MTVPNQPVTVGVDGSEGSVRAAHWASAEAGRRGAALHLVFVNDDPARAAQGERAVHEIAEQCRARTPGIAVTSETAAGHPVQELLRRSETAQLLVLGARGHGVFTDALLGGVSSSVAVHARCPVAVVRNSIPDSGPVVVGSDDSQCGQDAVRFALATASRAGADLVVLRAWHEEGLLALPLTPPDRERVQHEVERSLTTQTKPLREEHPEVRIQEVVHRGHPVAGLVDAAREARLVVVGHRGGGGFDGLFLGSVASGILHHAPCPVVVVH
ncbi:universal stress protein [Saccharopolyspora endophytica]|uniref:Universal stress protein n=1 Tax=Saccharopolyspora endophytica TaxID=543886 RepID=A0ABS5DFM1_9PSEU|nr:universal stress protein [Saccharopolyspora endophytica]MBQ0924937.1 universal stress protein [Saccharopolyspora endophytica]